MLMVLTNALVESGRQQTAEAGIIHIEWVQRGRGQLRAILWFYPYVGVDLEIDALTIETLSNLSHGIQLIHSLVGNDTHSLGAEVLQVHAHLLGHASSEPNGRSRHLKGILLEVGIGRRGEAAAAYVLVLGDGGAVVARVGVART